MWASSITRKKVVSALKSAQRPFALVLSRLFKSTSTDAALVLANILPLHLKVLEIVCKRALSNLSDFLPPSSWSLAGEIPSRILNSATPKGLSLSTHRTRALRSEIMTLWNASWSISPTGAQTRLFFPSVDSAFILSNYLSPFFLCSFLSGHCTLNNFLHKIKKSASPLFFLFDRK